MKLTIEIEVNASNFIGAFNQIEITPNGVYFNGVNSSNDTYNVGTGELLNTEEVFGKIVE